MGELQRHHPENIAPEQFMRPPTEVLGRQLADLAMTCEVDINSKAQEVANAWYPHIENSPVLRVGSELEILFLAPESSVARHSEDDRFVDAALAKNPNYTYTHSQNIDDLMEKLEQQHRNTFLYAPKPVTRESFLLVEVRTAPGSVQAYLDAMEGIKEWMHAHGKNVLPTAHSQHFHISLLEKDINLLGTDVSQRAMQMGMGEMYNRFLPLVLLPEEMEGDAQHEVDGAKVKGPPARIEGRLASSEYMFDPNLNILIQLVGFSRGLDYLIGRKTLKKTRPLSFLSFPTLQYGQRSYADAVKRMIEDPVLREYLPGNVVDILGEKAMAYLSIARGDTTVEEARNAVSIVPAQLKEEVVVPSYSNRLTQAVRNLLGELDTLRRF